MDEQRRRARAPRGHDMAAAQPPEVVDAMVDDVTEWYASASQTARQAALRQGAQTGAPDLRVAGGVAGGEGGDGRGEWTEAHALALPFPYWLTIGIPVVIAVTLAVVFFVETALLGGDWATGALAASVTAVALAVVSAGVLIARLALGRRTVGVVLLGVLLVATLVATAGAGVTQADPLRRAQAVGAERAGQWQLAVDEYGATGEVGPNAPDLARVYTAWGEALLRQGNYAGATVKFTTTLQKYADSGAALVARARADQFQTYGAWISSGAITLPFQQSLAFLASYAKDSGCGSACQQSIVNLTGQAHYQYGEQLAQAGQLKGAITQFEVTQSQYARSSFASKAHTAAATTYWALGQQLLTQDCASAVPVYQTLAKSYHDTTQGAQAATALAQPQDVAGVMSGLPSAAPAIYLSSHIDPKANVYSHDYKATLTAATGAFLFKNVKPGGYYLTTYRSISSTQEAFTYYKDTTTGKPYLLQVGPLCELNLGSLSY